MTKLIINYKKQDYIRQFALFMVVGMILFFVIMSAFSANADDSSGFSQSYIDQYERMYSEIDSANRNAPAFAFVAKAIGANPYWNFSVQRWIANVTSISQYGTLISLCANIYDGIRAIGVILITLYFFLGVIEKAQLDQFNAEQFLKKLIGLIIAYLVVINGANIFAWILDAVDTLRGEFIGGMDSAAENAYLEELAKVHDELLASSWIGAVLKMFVYLLEYGLPFITNIVYFVIALVVTYSRVLELVLRYMFAPIGIAPLVNEGLRSPGVRYIKKFISCAFQSILILATVKLGNYLPTVIDNGAGEFAAQLVFPIVIIAGLFRVRKISDDIWGV